MPSDKARLDWLEKKFDRADGEHRDRRSVTGRITRYLVWAKRSGASGDIRKTIDEEMVAAGVALPACTCTRDSEIGLCTKLCDRDSAAGVAPTAEAEGERLISITVGGSTHIRTADEWLALARADLKVKAGVQTSAEGTDK